MGAQIAAHLANADVEVLLFDLAQDERQPNAAIIRSIQQLARLEPAPLASRARLELIQPANYSQDLQRLRDCDWIIEAIAERPDLKTGLYTRIAPYLHDKALLTSNTSGISVNLLASALPEHLRARFCGVHFFNPPRYMPLVELVAGRATDHRVLDRLESFLVSALGKSVIRAKDTPNFVANRIGVFSLLATFHHAQRYGLAPDLVDALTGPLLGRPKSATFRTADVVGLDTLQHVVEGSARVLGDDPWVGYMRLPQWLTQLIERGALGQKSGVGVYRKQGKQIFVFDPSLADYRPATQQPDPALLELLNIAHPGERLAALRAHPSPQAQFLWAIQRDVWHYAAYWLNNIADNARDVDLAMRWGFAWQLGPFEQWQAAGWERLTALLQDDLTQGHTLAAAALPDWVLRIKAVHSIQGSYSPSEGRYKGRSKLSVYQRQLYPERVIGEALPEYGETVFQHAGARLWHSGDQVAVLSLTSKLHTLGEAELQSIHEALRIAEEQFAALVVWSPEAPFSAGANLGQIAQLIAKQQWSELERAVTLFQSTTQALRASYVPVVAAVQGLALGGGCELLLHTDHTVAALESYIGLVEVGVGLLPAGGGCKELARRAAVAAQGGELFPFIRRAFETIAKADVSRSAEHAQQLGLLRASDSCLFNAHELLYVAKTHAKALAESGYRPALPRLIPVAGSSAAATLRMSVLNLAEGGFISAHDYRVSCAIADVLCAAGLEAGTLVSEEWLLAQERRAFVELAQSADTQARIQHMLETGKPLRN